MRRACLCQTSFGRFSGPVMVSHSQCQVVDAKREELVKWENENLGTSYRSLLVEAWSGCFLAHFHHRGAELGTLSGPACYSKAYGGSCSFV